MILDSGIPHCCVAVNVATAKGSMVGSAYGQLRFSYINQSNILARENDLFSQQNWMKFTIRLCLEKGNRNYLAMNNGSSPPLIILAR
jgi:hypothetical protein